MFERILVATDSSEPSERAVQFAAKLAKDHGSEIIVLHAVPRVVSRYGTSDLEEPDAARELVDQIVRNLKDRGLNARGEVVRVLEGHMARGIGSPRLPRTPMRSSWAPAAGLTSADCSSALSHNACCTWPRSP